jgi:hypothetical protein
MFVILTLDLQHDEQAVLLAVDIAFKFGVPTKPHVLNLPHCLVDGKSSTPPTIDAPQALTSPTASSSWTMDLPTKTRMSASPSMSLAVPGALQS